MKQVLLVVCICVLCVYKTTAQCPFTVNAGSSVTICANQSTTLNATATPAGTYTYQWAPSGSLSSSTIANPIATPSDTTTYTVSVTSAGCTAVATVTVNVSGAALVINVTDSPSTVICPGTQLNLKASIVPTSCGVSPACNGNTTGPVIGSDSIAQQGTVLQPPTLFGNFNKSERNQMLYTAAELTASLGGACTIKGISFDIEIFNSNDILQSYTISFACTNSDSLTAFDNNLVQVVAPFSIQPGAGWNSFALTNAYNWDGVSNLIVDVCWYNPQTHGNQNNKAACTATNNCEYLWATSNLTSACDSAIMPTKDYFRPNVKFSYCQPDISNYNIVWTPSTGANAVSSASIPDPTANPVTSQTYTVAVGTGACVATKSVNVTVDTSRVSAGPDVSSCPGVAVPLSATVIGTVLPGPTPSFVWTTLSGTVVGTTQDITVTPTVNTTYVVAMSGGACTHYDTVNVTIGSLNVAPTVTDVKCTGQSNGKIVVTAGNGTSPYTYTWSANANSTVDSAVNLPASATPYSVTVSDVNHCTGSATVIITQPTSLPTISFTLTQVKCFGASDGAITANASGGTPNYTYTWNNPLPPGSSQTGLPTGSYSVTVTDANGCSVSSSVPLGGPTQITFPDSVIQNEKCAGGSTGKITITPTGGTGAYSYLWSNSGTTSTISNLSASTYTVTVTDANFCTVTAGYTISQPVGITFTAPTIDSTLCFGAANGSAEVFPSGGSAPYTYLWSNNQTTQTATGLSAHNYTVSVTDDSLCSTTTNVTIPQPNKIQITATDSNISCNGNNDGYAGVISTTNAYQPLSYLWSNNLTTQAITGLAANTYYVTVTDAHGCTQSDTFVITEPPLLALSAPTQTNVMCFGSATGSLKANATGGTGVYSYLWSNGVTTQTINGLVAGPYTVTVTDARGCTATNTYTITQPQSLPVFGTSNVSNVLCNGQSTGSIQVSVSGGTPGYTYSWSQNHQLNDSVATGLAANTYIVTATDANGCSISISNTVTQPQALVIDTSVVIEDSCHGGSTGSITVNASGGAGAPYTYTWNGAAGGSSESGLTAGAYSIIVTDPNLCTASITVVITQPAPIEDSITIQNVLCAGSSDGALTAYGYGGNPPFTYLWGDGTTTQLDSNLSVANNPYSVTITDNTGCKTTGTASLTQPDSLTFTHTETQVTCPGAEDGTIHAVAAGGTPPYDFSVTKDFTNFVSTTNGVAAGLDSGLYYILLTDNHGCRVDDTAYIKYPVVDTFSLSVDSTSCFGSNYTDGSITVTALTLSNTPYTYTIDGGQLQDTSYFGNLAAGPHKIVATNQFGCKTTLDTTVYQPQQAYTTVLPADTTLQLGQSIVLQSGFGPYPPSSIISYNWAPSMGLSCVDCPNPVATPYSHVSWYMLTITYNDNCVASDSMEIIVENNAKYFIPNSFTPNGDGVNDIFEVYGEDIKNVVLRVFNRWGEKVFESNNQFNGWDGTYKGVMQSPGVYTYDAQLIFLDDTKAEKHGSVTLIR